MAINYTNILIKEKMVKTLSAQECRANYKLRILHFFTPILNNSMKGLSFCHQLKLSKSLQSDDVNP